MTRHGDRDMPETPPDVVLLATDWRTRALIRAQLIEQGFDVVATDTWPMMRRHLRPGLKPRLALVDLKDLPDPADVVRDLRVLMKPESVLILTAIGTVTRAEIERSAFHALRRPIVIEDLVRAVTEAIPIHANEVAKRQTR